MKILFFMLKRNQKNLKVKLTAYKGQLIIETQNTENTDPDFVPAGEGRFGCVLSNSKKKLGISKEAMGLLKEIKRGNDGLGDVDAFESGNGNVVFGWIGGQLTITDPKEAVGSREYDTNLLEKNSVRIENEVPEGAMEAIDEQD